MLAPPKRTDKVSSNRKSNSRILRPAVIFLLLLLSVVGLYFFANYGKSENTSTDIKTKQTIEKKSDRRIEERKKGQPPHKAIDKSLGSAKKLKPQRVGEIRDGYVLLPSGDLYKVNGVVTTQVASTSIADKTFKYNAERQIAHLLLVEPGEGMLGSGEDLYSDFDKEFKESLKDEIVFDEEDTPEQRELKEALIDIRKELIERMNNGEDLSHVMIETRKQLQEMALYKEELQEEVEKLRKDGNLSKQDRLELLEAANKMLEERGIQPFLIPSSLQRLIDIRESQK
jgi:hypothetical protein